MLKTFSLVSFSYLPSSRKEVVSVLKKHLSLMRMGCNEIEEEATITMTQS